MKLVIVSNMSHYQRDGQIVGWGPTVQEISWLAGQFDEVRHVACLHPEPAPPSALPYSSDKVKLVLVPAAGGPHFRDKLGILKFSPLYIKTILRELADADAVHVRCPANISMYAVIMLGLLKQPKMRWVKYAGNWKPDERESWSYSLQRWWLEKGLHKGVVTVNGKWPGQPRHIYSFLNPSLTEEEILSITESVRAKQLSSPLNLLFVGRVEGPKGARRGMQIAKILKDRNVSFEYHLAGDGPERPSIEAEAHALGLKDQVFFHGWLPKTVLPKFYSRAHFMLFPTAASEGWPKAASEAMAYGAVPIIGAVSSIPQIIAETGAGIALPPYDVQAFANTLMDYVAHPERWKTASEAGLSAAPRFTYETYVRTVDNMFKDAWGVSPVTTLHSCS